LTIFNKKPFQINPILVSNRLPIKLERIDKEWEVRPGSGGLVTALAPVLKNNQGIWIGWPGAAVTRELKELLSRSAEKIGYHLETVDLTDAEIKGFYRGFSNTALWPLFHDLLGPCNFDTREWETYQKVNFKFAAAVAACAREKDFIWVQDYHLILVGHFLNELGFRNKAAFFLHIPFPPKDIFIKMPWRQEIIEGFLAYRLIGFQTERDRRNFIYCLKHLLPAAHISHHKKYPFIKFNNNVSRIGAFPISIDFRSFCDDAASREVADAAWYIHEKFPERKIILGVDRLDYTKGIPHRLLAFENCLERYPELKQKISLVQIVVPSRTEVAEYKQMKRQIDEMVGRINSRFTRYGWIPIHYIYNSLNRTELLGYYKASEIALITPLKDGMNLVAKEYCAACIDDIGVLVLSEFAGAASRLDVGALLVNPYNIEEVADSIHQAFHMRPEEQKARMKKMRAEIRKNNVFRWLEQFINSFYSFQDIENTPDGREIPPSVLSTEN
jgi:trehalose 6-phosphate synthase/phosphatase